MLAVSPSQDAAVTLSLEGGGSAQDAAQKFFGAQAIRTGNPWRSSIGSLPAVSSTFAASRDQGEDLVGLAAFVQDGDRVYRLLGFTTQSRFQGYSGAFEASVGSFGRLRDRRYLEVEPKRIDLVRLPSAMTLRQFAERYPSTVDLADARDHQRHRRERDPPERRAHQASHRRRDSPRSSIPRAARPGEGGGVPFPPGSERDLAQKKDRALGETRSARDGSKRLPGVDRQS